MLLRLGGFLLLATFLTSPVSGESVDGNLQYFLHAEGECSGDGPELYMDQEDTDGDTDACGVAGPGVQGFDAAYPGTVPLNASIVEGSRAVAHIFLSSVQPDQFNVVAKITAGRASCEGDSGPKNVAGPAVVADWVEFQIACTFKGTASAEKLPSLALEINAKASYIFGYEDDHASRIDFDALGPAAAVNATNTTTPAPGEKSPGLPFVVVLGGSLVAACAWVARRR